MVIQAKMDNAGNVSKILNDWLEGYKYKQVHGVARPGSADEAVDPNQFVSKIRRFKQPNATDNQFSEAEVPGVSYF